ncbi:MAG: hypothetical protein WCT77_06065, partial [Bacteroidota bacterium]
DLYDNVARDTGIANLLYKTQPGKKDDYGIRFRRIFLTYDYDISSKLSARFRLEANDESLNVNGTIGVFLKDAYVEWKEIFEGAKLTVGMQPTFAFDLTELLYGYRSLDKTMLDLRGIIASRDIAVSLTGQVDKEGMFNYGLMFGNNSGNSPESNKFKRIAGRIYVKPIRNLHIAVYGDLRHQANSMDQLCFSGLIGYMEKGEYSLGLEAFSQSNNDSYQKNGKSATQNQLGFSIFGTYNIMPELALTARYDMFDNNIDTDVKGDSRNYIVAGLDWKVDKKFSIIPNIQYETYEQIPNSTWEIKPSLTARITFVYNY